jgi:anthranilate synthase component 2
MMLLIDNYDSFTYNIADYFAQLSVSVQVVKNNHITIADIKAMAPRWIVISPGPCSPVEAGVSVEVVRQLHPHYPILGICLGHQAIAYALGGKVIRAPQPMHAKVSNIVHNKEGIFSTLASPLAVARYHSLMVDPSHMPESLKVTARTNDKEQIIMALSHHRYPLFGVQFHPESLASMSGLTLFENFLRSSL